MKIELNVVEENGALLFKAKQGVSFDELRAFDFFVGGKIAIKRAGCIFDQTERVQVIGTHGARPCFIGLNNVFPKHSYNWSIKADCFQRGDTIEIEFPAVLPKDFDLGRFVAVFNRDLDATIDVLKRHPQGISLGDLKEELKKRS